MPALSCAPSPHRNSEVPPSLVWPPKGHELEHSRAALRAALMCDQILEMIIADSLLRANPEKFQVLMGSISAIDSMAQDSEKIESLLGILEQHSKHSVVHLRRAGGIMRSLKDSRADVLQGMDFNTLAQAMESHDVGKLGVNQEILNTPHPEGLNDSEKNEMNSHPILSYYILSLLHPENKQCARIALTHHLRYKMAPDGQLQIVGYPVQKFLDYCGDSHQERKLLPEDHLAAFVDVFSASTEIGRPTKSKSGSNNPDLSWNARRKIAIADMKMAFCDRFYQTGEGAALFQAFEQVILAHDDESFFLV